MKYEIKNAVINDTFLGYEDHGIMTFYLSLNYSYNSGQSFGGYALDTHTDKHGFRRIGTAFGLTAIIKVLKVVGVEKWEDLKGKSIRVEMNSNKIKRIGNYLEDEWLDLKELAEEFDLRG